MKFETKFDNNDKVWILDTDTLKPIEVEIDYISANSVRGEANVSYRLKDKNVYVDESKVFASKDELIAYIAS